MAKIEEGPYVSVTTVHCTKGNCDAVVMTREDGTNYINCPYLPGTDICNDCPYKIWRR